MVGMSSTSDAPVLPADLTAAIVRAGYYPALVADVVAAALVREPIENHLVHLETTFDRDVVRRHITVLVLTPTRLLIAHADDHADEPPAPQDVATATTESIPLSAVRGVMLTHVVENPSTYVPGSLGREITLTLGLGHRGRLDLVPASCADPDCDADHGYEGTITGDDIALRISAAADGDDALSQALGLRPRPVRRHRPGLTGRMPPTGDPSAHPPVGAGPALADVLPSVARSLGVPGGGGRRGAAPGFDLPPDPARGDRARRRARPRPARASGRPRAVAARAPGRDPAGGQRASRRRRRRRWAPSAPASPPGRTGCSATRCSCPATDRLLNELSWEDGPDPRTLAAARDGLRGGGRGRGRGRAGRPGLLRRLGADQRGASAGAGSSPRRTLAQRVDATLGRGALGAASARAPLLGRARQGRPRARLRLLAVGRRARERSTASWPGSPRGCPTTAR